MAEAGIPVDVQGEQNTSEMIVIDYLLTNLFLLIPLVEKSSFISIKSLLISARIV